MSKNRDRVDIRVFIQARMSSSRFPGKVLAPFRGQPIVANLVRSVQTVIPRDRLVVATSTEPSDDPLAVYLESLHVPVFRGSLNDVFGRFQACLQAFPCQKFVRICADSPLLNADLLAIVIEKAKTTNADLVTNVFPRSFPVGQSMEAIDARTFANLDCDSFSPEEREHLTAFYYRHPQTFTIVNISSTTPELAGTRHAVDTLEDLRCLEHLPPIACRLTADDTVEFTVSEG